MPHFTLVGHTLNENYLPQYAVTFVYAILPEFLLLTIMDRNRGDKKSSLSSKNHRSSILREVKAKPYIVVILVLLVVATVFVNPTSYFYSNSISDSMYESVGGVPFNSTTGRGLSFAAEYLDAYSNGQVFWFPEPPLIGESGYPIARSYPYPYYSDGPFSSELFNFLRGNYPDSLINSDQYYALAYISALIGVRFFVFYDGEYQALSNQLMKTPYFSVAEHYDYVTILKDNLYSNLVHVSNTALLISGGLSVYASYLEENSKDGGQMNLIPYMADTYPFFNLAGSYDILTDNLTQTFSSISVMLSGYKYLIFPYLNITTLKGWYGGNIADAEGYAWDSLAAYLPNYSWQSTFTVSDGVIYTFGKANYINFSVDKPTDNYELLIRVFNSKYGSSMTLDANGYNYSVNLAPTNESRFVWLDLGTMNISKEARISITSNGFTAINAIDLVPSKVWDKSEAVARSILSNHKVILQSKNNDTVLLSPNNSSYIKSFDSSNFSYFYPVNLTTSSTPYGKVVTEVRIQNYSFPYLYMIVPGAATTAIPIGVYASVDGEILNTIPAAGGAMSFIYEAHGGTNELTFKIVWVSESVLLENVISYATLTLVLIVFLILSSIDLLRLYRRNM